MILSKSFEKPEQALRHLCQAEKTGTERLDEKYLRNKSSTASSVEGKFVCVKYAGEIVSDC